MTEERLGASGTGTAARFASAVIALGLVGVLVGCGKSASPATSGSPGKTASAYVSAMCSSLMTWGQAFKTEAGNLQSKVAAAPTLADKKQVFVDFTDNLTTTTDTLIGRIRGLGVPAVDGGAAVESQLVTAFQRARETLAAAHDKAKALPTDDINAFKKQVTDIGTSIGSLGDAFSGVGNMKNDALDKAFSSDPTCAQMNSLFSS